MRLKIVVLGLLLFSMTACLKQKTEGVVVANATIFEEKMQESDVQLIDVRSPEEFAEGHIPNAVNININGDNFDEEVAKLDKEKPIMVYCRMGGRSAKAAANLKAQGFKSITDLDGGITSWKDANKTIEE